MLAGRIEKPLSHPVAKPSDAEHGFVDRFSVIYRGFRYEDKFVFASIQEHDLAILMDKSLSQPVEE